MATVYVWILIMTNALGVSLNFDVYTTQKACFRARDSWAYWDTVDAAAHPERKPGSWDCERQELKTAPVLAPAG